MKKVLRRLVIGLLLVTVALSFAACTRTANTTPAYVNTYYVNGTKTETKYISVLSDGTWYMLVKDSDNVTLDSGRYYFNGSNGIKFYYAGASVDAGIMGELKDNVWTITVTATGEQFIKEAAATGCQNANWSSYLIFGILFLGIIALFIWSSISKKKQSQKAQATVNALKVGDRVKTIGGICGFVSEINDLENTFVLEVKAGDASSLIKFDKGAIYQTAPANGNGTEVKEEPKAEPIAEETATEEKAEPKKTRKKKDEDNF